MQAERSWPEFQVPTTQPQRTLPSLREVFGISQDESQPSVRSIPNLGDDISQNPAQPVHASASVSSTMDIIPLAPQPASGPQIKRSVPANQFLFVDSAPTSSRRKHNKKVIATHLAFNQHRRKRAVDVQKHQAKSKAVESLARGFSNREIQTQMVIRPSYHTQANRGSGIGPSDANIFQRDVRPKDHTGWEDVDSDGEEQEIRQAAFSGSRLLELFASKGHQDLARIPSFLDKAELDPFLTGGIQLTKQVNWFIFHYLDLNRTVLPVEQPRIAHLHWVLSLALTQPRVLFGVLALSAAYYAARSGKLVYGTQTVYTERDALDSNLPDFIKYKIKAAKILNQRMANPAEAIEVSTIFGMACLLTIDLLAGNMTEISSHLIGLQRLMSQRNGFEGFPFNLIESLLVIWYMCATMTRAPPPINPPPPRSPASFSMPDLIASSRPEELNLMAFALYSPRYATLFDQVLLQTCHNLRDVVVFREHHAIAADAFSSTDGEYFMIRNYEVQYTLLSLPFVPTAEVISDKHEPFRVSLLIFVYTQLAIHPPSSALMRNLTLQLREALEYSDLRSFWAPGAQELLVWILFLGAHISAGQVERPWFVMLLARGTRMIGARTWEDVRRVMVRYFFIERVYGESWRGIWEEVRLLMDTV